MSEQIISRQELSRWLADLLPSYTVVAPVRHSTQAGAQAIFKVIGDGCDEIAWDAGRTGNSAKEFFFPMSEAIVTWRMGPDGLRVNAPVLMRPQVLFGARPCDGQALDVLDRLLLDEPVDVYYAARRAMTTVVGWACDTGFEGCFCETMGGGPADRTHLDALLTPVDDGGQCAGYLVDAVTDKGRTLLESAAVVARDRSPQAITSAAGANSVSNHSAATVGRRSPKNPDLRLPTPEQWRARFNDPMWAEVAERCLGCRACTYDCPVCYCFDIRDRTRPDGVIERLRCWDSCQGALCFAIAGGHNPRATQAERQRQRYMHKFLYYPEREGTPLCVGCGRCVVDCPANVDIREVIAAVAAAGASA